ncbi:hypothetical protein EDB81DRAFT_638217 [Dactylonectria macrodidyma]|uniref:Zn(2)-C6 fungal-type domain-containing protein n=1 Tax=Dactylonectria macrodidyma TaxID=307937 RepID=A0A9P9FNV2_9HYPO|nr:hypothetical protein EDB81DRAFT_638217 [Dactylonectria macrodidyma]
MSWVPWLAHSSITRRRRIKCDEDKPTCRRCVKAGLACDISLPSVLTPGTVPDCRILLEPSYVLNLFKDQQQWDMFSVFIFSNEQAGTMPVNILSAMTPQIAHQNVAVREVCCAIGAATSPFTVPESDPAADEMLYQMSLTHYNRALRAIRDTESSTSALLTVVLVSILFVTYDMLRGDMPTAFIHFNYGCRIFNTYFEQRCREANLPFSKLPLSSIEAAAVELLQRLTTQPWALDLGFSGSRVDKVTEWPSYSLKSQHSVLDMPDFFQDLAKALKWLGVTQNFLLHRMQTNKSDGQMALGNAAWEESLGALERWHKNFAPLLQSARQRKADEPSTLLQACILESLYLETLINLHLHHRRDANLLPDVKQVYREILHTARELQQHYQGLTKTFLLDNAIMRPLTFVLWKCRDADLRQDVKDILVACDKSSRMAAVLLSMMDRKQGDEIPQKMRNIERSLGWYFTSCGCSLEAMSLS